MDTAPIKQKQVSSRRLAKKSLARSMDLTLRFLKMGDRENEYFHLHLMNSFKVSLYLP